MCTNKTGGALRDACRAIRALSVSLDNAARCSSAGDENSAGAWYLAAYLSAQRVASKLQEVVKAPGEEEDETESAAVTDEELHATFRAIDRSLMSIQGHLHDLQESELRTQAALAMVARPGRGES